LVFSIVSIGDLSKDRRKIGHQGNSSEAGEWCIRLDETGKCSKKVNKLLNLIYGLS
jgi:hypothetical protein